MRKKAFKFSHQFVRKQPLDLPAFGQGDGGRPRREEDRGTEAGRQTGEAGARETNLPSYSRVKQEDEAYSPLDEYFCKGMDTSGPAAWATVLQDMAAGNLPDVGQLNTREDVAFDLRTVKFPPTQTSSVLLIQNFEADFIRAMGIISPSAALYAQAEGKRQHRPRKG